MKATKIMKGIAAAAALSCMLTVTAFAEESAAVLPSAPMATLSQKGYVSITLPTEEWKEVASDEACVVFSNGSSIITFDYYSRDAKVPMTEVPAGDNVYYHRSVDVCKDLQLVFEAHSESEVDFMQMKNAIANAVVNTSLLPKEVVSHEIVEDNYSIEAADYIAYVVADELNIRPEGSSNGAPIGTLYYAGEVHVTGTVLLNGAANGWVRIDCNGGNGYVSTSFLSDTAPSVKVEETEAASSSSSSAASVTKYPLTFSQISDRISYTASLYRLDGTPLKLYALTDGSMIDMNGYPAYGYADGAYQLYSGEIVFEFDPTTTTLDEFVGDEDSYEENVSKTVFQDDGSYWNIYKKPDGTWYDIYGNQFWMNEAGIWFNLTDHSEWYE